MKNFKDLGFSNGKQSVVLFVEQLEELQSPMNLKTEEIIDSFLFCFAYLCDPSSGKMAKAILGSFDSAEGKAHYLSGLKNINLFTSEIRAIKLNPILGRHYNRVGFILKGQLSRERMINAYEKDLFGERRTKTQMWIRHYTCFKALSQEANEQQLVLIRQIKTFFSLLAYQVSESGMMRYEMKKLISVGLQQNAGTSKFIVPPDMDQLIYFARKFEKLFILAGQYHSVQQRVLHYGFNTFAERTDNLLRATYFILRDNLKKYNGISGEAIIKQVLTALIYEGEDAAWEIFNSNLSKYPDMVPEWAIEKYCLENVVGPNSRSESNINRKVEASKQTVKDRKAVQREVNQLNAIKALSTAELRKLADDKNCFVAARATIEYRMLLKLVGSALEMTYTDGQGKEQKAVFSNARYGDSPYVYMERNVIDAETGKEFNRSRKVTLYNFCLHMLYGDLKTDVLNVNSVDRLQKLNQSPFITQEMAAAINDYLSQVEKKAITLYLDKALAGMPTKKARDIIGMIIAKL